MSGGQVVTMFVLASVSAVAIALAALQMRTGRFPRFTLWSARILVLCSIAVSIIAMYSAVWEIRTNDYPLTQPGAPLGTYHAPSALGVGIIAVLAGLLAIAGILAWFRPTLAARLFVLGGVLIGLSAGWNFITDDTMPVSSPVIALVAITLPTLAVAALLRALPAPLLPSFRGDSS